ncbi:hypothetical protein BaRGS_00015719 [Batillaria attramentaria]|uniref:Uncharacterized protein n=1 Tax=Batillaria attramentaria TaxID=370345 RepID=A0ABD0L0G1_9CAEN
MRGILCPVSPGGSSAGVMVTVARLPMSEKDSNAVLTCSSAQYQATLSRIVAATFSTRNSSSLNFYTPDLYSGILWQASVTEGEL